MEPGVPLRPEGVLGLLPRHALAGLKPVADAGVPLRDAMGEAAGDAKATRGPPGGGTGGLAPSVRMAPLE